MQLFLWKNPDSWPGFLGKELVVDREIEESYVSRFYEEYTHIRVYHASRPLDPERIRSEGLRIARYQRLIDEFRSNVATYCGIVLEDEHINYAKSELGHFHDERLFVVVNDEDLLNHAGHYAIYGSEYLLGIANRIFGKFGFFGASQLTKFGVPTVYEINLPIEMLSEDDISSLVREINNHVYEDGIGHHVDFTFELHQAIPASYIVGLYHPKEILDPLNRPNVYVHH